MSINIMFRFWGFLFFFCVFFLFVFVDVFKEKSSSSGAIWRIVFLTLPCRCHRIEF